MGETAQTDQVAEARATFEREVYAPAFAEKCAELGVSLDEESLQDALETVRHIKTAATTQSTSLTKAARSDLQAAMGLARPEEKAAAEQAAKEATEAAQQGRLQTAFKALAGAAASRA